MHRKTVKWWEPEKQRTSIHLPHPIIKAMTTQIKIKTRNAQNEKCVIETDRRESATEQT